MVVTGVAPFTSAPRWLVFGALIGLAHTAIQWITTSAVIRGRAIESRNLLWSSNIDLADITEVYEVHRRGWRGVRVTVADGTSMLLPVPTSSALSPNPHFEEEVLQLCASVAGDAQGGSVEF